ncbi:GH92 family glycosyl hydrolase [Sporolactobacillus spathodeae]|uniref:Alpha-1,2-mannosidase n=1 Tax=Sporolactobacillus spathodeae TaxID=1465502 RepID=A0ABS2Q7B9_9BACL|nr:GH92 family glycosyl hydrolase [Sporolactobacillus spathodeae]MBM7657491.1 putative alpha-1,2-mannosidase [Sporolactobacillus spathodeae]
MKRHHSESRKDASLMKNKQMIAAFHFFLCFVLIAPILPLTQARAESHSEIAATAFATSFEKGQALPLKSKRVSSEGADIYWTDRGTRIAGLKTTVANGPTEIYHTTARFGWTGKKVLYYSGTIGKGKKRDVRTALFHTRIQVKKNSVLSYYIAPLVSDKQTSARASNVSIDLAFSDGTYLHQYKNVTDQDGFSITPSAQGASGTLITNQWNHKSVAIGQTVGGKTITGILLSYRASQSSGSFRGALDDLSISLANQATAAAPVDSVNILRGTASSSKLYRGNTVPAVGVPNGFAYWSPAIDSSSANHFYPYQQNNNPSNQPMIQSFSLSHSANATDGDRQSFQVMPSDFSGTPSASRLNRSLAYSHMSETAQPNLYKVSFLNGIQAEMTALSHSAILRFTFKGNSSNLIFDNIDKNGHLSLSPNRKELYGYSDVTNGKTGESARLYFYGTVDQPVIDQGHLYGQDRDKVTGFYKFDTSVHKTVTLRIASSLISVNQARKNLNLEVGSKVSFQKASKEAADAWNKRLKRITVKGATALQQTTLYSNLYRLYLSPNSTSENTGTAKKPIYQYADLAAPLKTANGPLQTGARIRKGMNYNSGNFQYTAQTVWPAYELLEPKRTGKILNSYLRDMTKDDSLISASEAPYAEMTLADAVQNAIPGLNAKSVYDQVLKSASNRMPPMQTFGQKNTNNLLFNGELTLAGSQSASRLLADCQRDYALGELAASLAKGSNASSYADDSAFYLKQAQNYIHLFDVPTMLTNKPHSGRNSLLAPSQALNDANPQLQNRSWRLAFAVPQDGQGLANRYGGQRGLAAKLNQWITATPTINELSKKEAAREAFSGGLGSFTLSSPDSPSLAYMYLFAKQPDKTQTMVRELLNRFYTGSDIGQGYLGSDTDAMLSSFYIFAAAGIYPLQKGSGNYVLNAPFFKEMTIHLENGRNLTIKAPAVSNRNRYIQSVIFNNQTYSNSSISQSMLKKGGTLLFVMGERPSNWGTGSNQLPNSLTPVSTNGSSFYPKPLEDLIRTDKIKLTTNGKLHTDFLSEINTVRGDSTDAIIQADFSSQSPLIRMYTLTSSENSGTSDPKSWILYGSTDGKTWHPIDTRKNERFSWRLMTRAFLIKDPQPFRYYRLTIIDHSDNHALSLGSIQLLGYNGIVPAFNQVERNLIRQFERNDLSENQTASLLSLINKAESAYQAQDIPSAISYLQIYVRTIDSFVNATGTTSTVRGQLSADGHALINLLVQ